jgi:hypothetical protein
MNCLVIVREESPDRYVAVPAGVPELQVEAPTEAAAVDLVRQSLTNWFATSKLVEVDVPGNGPGPWLGAFGRSADDPDFDDYLQHIQHYRESVPAE